MYGIGFIYLLLRVKSVGHYLKVSFVNYTDSCVLYDYCVSGKVGYLLLLGNRYFGCGSLRKVDGQVIDRL